MQTIQRPTAAFVGASYAALGVSAAFYLIGLWNAALQLNEKGYYLSLLLYGLFAALSLQKSVRDRAEGIPVTGMYVGLCWGSLGSAIALFAIGLWNATLALSEKGFYAIAYMMALFAVIAVQKNVRDLQAARRGESGLAPS